MNNTTVTLDADDIAAVKGVVKQLARALGLISIEMSEQFIDPETGEDLPEEEGGDLTCSWGAMDDSQFSYREAQEAFAKANDRLSCLGIYYND